MKCPNCSLPLQVLKKYDTDIDYCPTCKGVWLDKGELDKIATAQTGFDQKHYMRYHSDRAQNDYDDDYYDYSGHRNGRGFFGDLFDL